MSLPRGEPQLTKNNSNFCPSQSGAGKKLDWFSFHEAILSSSAKTAQIAPLAVLATAKPGP